VSCLGNAETVILRRPSSFVSSIGTVFLAPQVLHVLVSSGAESVRYGVPRTPRTRFYDNEFRYQAIYK
jgi:hypothetical protein